MLDRFCEVKQKARTHINEYSSGCVVSATWYSQMMHFRMKLDPNDHDDQSNSLDMFTPCVLRRTTVFIGEVTSVSLTILYGASVRVFPVEVASMQRW